MLVATREPVAVALLERATGLAFHPTASSSFWRTRSQPRPQLAMLPHLTPASDRGSHAASHHGKAQPTAGCIPSGCPPTLPPPPAPGPPRGGQPAPTGCREGRKGGDPDPKKGVLLRPDSTYLGRFPGAPGPARHRPARPGGCSDAAAAAAAALGPSRRAGGRRLRRPPPHRSCRHRPPPPSRSGSRCPIPVPGKTGGFSPPSPGPGRTPSRSPSAPISFCLGGGCVSPPPSASLLPLSQTQTTPGLWVLVATTRERPQENLGGGALGSSNCRGSCPPGGTGTPSSLVEQVGGTPAPP